MGEGADEVWTQLKLQRGSKAQKSEIVLLPVSSMRTHPLLQGPHKSLHSFCLYQWSRRKYSLEGRLLQPGKAPSHFMGQYLLTGTVPS